MQQVIIGPKYQIVIPKEVRKKVKGIKPGNKVSLKVQSGHSITVKPLILSWSDVNYGKYKKHLKGAAAEVQKMRNEWEEGIRNIESIK